MSTERCGSTSIKSASGSTSTIRRTTRSASCSSLRRLQLLDPDREGTHRRGRRITSQRLSRRHRPRGRAELPARTWGQRRGDPAQDAHWCLGRRFRTGARSRARRLRELRRLLGPRWQQLGANKNGATAGMLLRRGIKRRKVNGERCESSLVSVVYRPEATREGRRRQSSRLLLTIDSRHRHLICEPDRDSI